MIEFDVDAREERIKQLKISISKYQKSLEVVKKDLDVYKGTNDGSYESVLLRAEPLNRKLKVMQSELRTLMEG